MKKSVVSRKMLLCGISTLLASCTVSMSREEQVQNLLSPPSVESSIAEAFESCLFIPGCWPVHNWWTVYGSEELNALIELALECNQTLQAVYQRINFAKNEATIARSKLFPLISFSASDQWEHLSKNGLYRALNPDLSLNATLIDFSLSFSYEFDFWGKYRNLYYAALGKEQTALAEAAQASLIATTALAQAYFALKTNLVRKCLYEQLYKTRKKLFDLQTQLLENALDSKLIPLFSEEGVFEAEQWVYEIEQEIAVGKHMVNVLAGRGPDECLGLNEFLPELPEQLAIPLNLSTELLSRRPDLMAQIWRLDALAYEVGAAKADFWPNINLSALLGLESTSWSKLFQWASTMVGLIPGFNLPIYTAGAIGANVDAKKALFQEAVHNYNELILKSFQQIADLLAIGRALYAQKEKQSHITANAKQRYALATLRLEKGIDNALNTYQVLEEELQKELEEVELLYQQYVVSVNLTKALGGGYFSGD